MAVPQKEGPYPLALIMHGSHDNLNDKNRFDTGFTYLAQYLAENGYLAISIHASQAYQWKYGDSDDQEKVMHIADQLWHREQQRLTVELKDGTGKRAQVSIPDYSNSIKVSIGEIRTTELEELIYKYWFPVTPIGNISGMPGLFILDPYCSNKVRI